MATAPKAELRKALVSKLQAKYNTVAPSNAPLTAQGLKGSRTSGFIERSVVKMLERGGISVPDLERLEAEISPPPPHPPHAARGAVPWWAEGNLDDVPNSPPQPHSRSARFGERGGDVSAPDDWSAMNRAQFDKSLDDMAHRKHEDARKLSSHRHELEVQVRLHWI
jgi:hypothetical protein